MRLLRQGFKGLRATVQGGYGGSRAVYGRGYGGGRGGIDMRAEAGRRVDNSIVYAAIAKTVLPLLEADLFVARPDADGRLQRVAGHPIEALLRQPVPWMSGHSVRSLWHMARVLDGNAYTLKHRSGSGKLIGLEYLPLSTCFPYSNPGSGNFIDGYQVASVYGTRPLGPDDVLHLRWHTLNPWAPAIAISPLEACLPEIAADNRAANYEAAVLRNGPNAFLLSPRGTDKNGNPVTFDREQRAQLAEMMREDAGGDNAGSVLAVGYPMDSTQIALKPTDIMLGPVHDLSEERIAACLGAPASWIGLGSGLEMDSNRATRETVVEQVLNEFILPQYTGLCQQLTEDLVPDLGEEGEVVTFDRKGIGAFVQQLMAIAIAGVQATGGPTMTPNEFRRTFLDMDEVEGGDALRTTGAPPPMADDSDAPPKPNPDKPAKGEGEE